jgi:phage baseplate assembly protein W
VTEQFIGAGWAFPLRTTPAGGIALATGERELVEAIQLILSTAPGERPMRPEFGCGIHDYVFAPADEDTAGRIAFEVRAALDRWEPRITVSDVVIEFDEQDAGVLYIDIRYTVRDENDPRNLVFPFYVIPDETAPAEPVPLAPGGPTGQGPTFGIGTGTAFDVGAGGAFDVGAGTAADAAAGRSAA